MSAAKAPVISGVVGSIRWHYYTAAAINGWTVAASADRRRWTLLATVALSDAFKMSQRPLAFVAPLKGGREWRWPLERFSMETRNGVPVLVGELGPEASDHGSIRCP